MALCGLVFILLEFHPTGVLLNYFQNFPEFEIIATFNNWIEALDFLNNNTVDALFLDINMPLMSGFELIQLYKNKSNTKIIITTAFREFAAESYDLDVLDYLVKPIPLPRFIKCISKITGEFQNRMVSKQDNSKNNTLLSFRAVLLRMVLKYTYDIFGNIF